MKTQRLIKTLLVISLVSGMFTALLPGKLNAQTSRDSSSLRATGQSPNGAFFTGVANVVRIPMPAGINCGAARVSFQPGARTVWHAHAGGQVIIVTSGIAWYQEKGKPKQIIAQGGEVVCPPGVMHWHGASPDSPMTHSVVTPNLDRGGVTSGLAVTDNEYLGSK